jgi:hypothetical protein
MTEKSVISKNTQNIKLNIEKIYRDFFYPDNGLGINNIRSNINIIENQSKLTKFTENNFNGENGINLNNDSDKEKQLKPETSAQESRCHAFYRIIGFPVVSKSKGIYNPGHDIYYAKDQEKKEITSQKKANIANDQLDGFLNLSLIRESYYNTILNSFFNNNSVEAGVLALSSVNLRNFSDCLKNIDPKDFSLSDLSYKIDTKSIVGKNSNVDFSNYVDELNNKPKEKFIKEVLRQRFHIIKPFIVDPRIDITCPAEKKIAIPFLPDDSFLKVNENFYTKRPYIELIIINRFNNGNQAANSGDYLQSTLDAIKKIESIKDEKILNDISSGNLYGYEEKQRFIYHINIIRAMAIELDTAIKGVKSIQSNYYCLPIPNTNGPEFGCGVRDVFRGIFIDKDLSYLTTDKDKEIIKSTLLSDLKNFNIELLKSSSPDVSSYSFSKVENVFETSDGFENTALKQKNKLSEIRNSDLNKISAYLKKIEIIMGEFSGFGLCDVFAILGALYIMPKESLLGFLDDDAFARAKKFSRLSGQLPDKKPTIDVALKDLTTNVKVFYDLMDKIIKDYINLNKNQ